MPVSTLMTAPAVTRFRRIANITVGAVIALILIGSLVRMTGSGMGCPDWPKCFGQWVPPTDVSQLPEDYQSIFAVAGKEIAEFDAFKTWVEYLNRLFGVLVGILGIATVAAGFSIRKGHSKAFYWSLGGLFLTLLAGGLGAYVVKTDLHEGMITIHMIVALGVLTAYLIAVSETNKSSISEKWKGQVSSRDLWIGGVVVFLVLTQIVMGTQVREQVDALLKEGIARDNWIDRLQGAYGIHKFSHYAVTGIILLWFRGLRSKAGQPVRILMMAVIGFLLTEIGLGLGMHHFSVPAAFQPLHLLFATLLFAATFLIMRWLWMANALQTIYEEKLVHGH